MQELIIITTSMEDSEQKTVKFLKTVEAGDIALYKIIPEAIAMFGYTRVGKTATCHILCDSPLRAEQQRGELIYNPTSQKFINARVGHTTDSETEIPNIFQHYIKEKDLNDKEVMKKIWILDQPGYGDTYGFHRIFSNGYFHYRTFSKTPKLKFVLAITKTDLQGTGEKFKKTIFNFINSFTNWDRVKTKVLAATSILITKADVGTQLVNLESVINMLHDAVRGMGPKQTTKYQETVKAVLNAKRIFFIQKPKSANSYSRDITTLQQIYEKSEFWEREVQKDVVSMEQINFSVANEILRQLRDRDNQTFREEFESFMDYTEKRRMSVIVNHQASLINLVKILQSDAISDNQSHEFLDQMQKFIGDYYNFFPAYQERRDRTEVQLFMSPDTQRWAQLSADELNRETRSVYFIKKFKVIDFLTQLGRQVEENMLMLQRNINELEQFSNIFIAFFKRLSILRIDPRDKTIYKYAYIVQRIIEESKILSLILFINESIRVQVEQCDVKTFSEDIFRILKDKFFTLTVSEIKVFNLKEKFISKLDFNKFTAVSEEIITFFQSIPGKTNEITQKIAYLVLEYSLNLYKNDRVPSDQEIKFSILKLLKYRNDFYFHHQNLIQNNAPIEQREEAVELIFKMTNSLANLLLKKKMYEEARECYRSINNAHLVFQVYEVQCKTLANQPEKHRELLIKQAEQAINYCRKQLAMKCCQQAYALSTRYSDLKQVSDLIEKWQQKENQASKTKDEQDTEGPTYLQRIFQKTYCLEFSQQLQQSIEFCI